MSLILDALNRSRQDADPVPGLATQHPMEQVSPGKRQWLPWIALAVALLVVAWLLLERGSDAPAVPPGAEVAAPMAEAPRRTGNEAPVAGAQFESRKGFRREVGAVGTAVPAPRTAADQRDTRIAAAEVPTRPVAKPSAPAARVVTSDAVEQLYRQRETALPDAAQQAPAAPAPQSSRQAQEPEPVKKSGAAQRDEKAVDIERLLTEAREEIENTSLAEHPAPFLASLSQNTKNAIPTVLYQRHDYTNQAGRSVVLLNGKSLGVGGSPAPGMKVDEILPDSVVLTYNGTQFRLRALNSWVNL